jgi:hypothetical protein
MGDLHAERGLQRVAPAAALARALSSRSRQPHRLPLHTLPGPGQRPAPTRDADGARAARHPACLRGRHRCRAGGPRFGCRATRCGRRQAGLPGLVAGGGRSALRRHRAQQPRAATVRQPSAAVGGAPLGWCQADRAVPVPARRLVAAVLPGHPDPRGRQSRAHRRTRARLPPGRPAAGEPPGAGLVQGARRASAATQLRARRAVRATGAGEGPSRLERAPAAAGATGTTRPPLHLQGAAHGERDVDHHGPPPARRVLPAPRPRGVLAGEHPAERAVQLLPRQRRPASNEGGGQPRQHRDDRSLCRDADRPAAEPCAHRHLAGGLHRASRRTASHLACHVAGTGGRSFVVERSYPAGQDGVDVRLRLHGSAGRHRARHTPGRDLHQFHGLLHLPQRGDPASSRARWPACFKRATTCAPQH